MIIGPRSSWRILAAALPNGNNYMKLEPCSLHNPRPLIAPQLGHRSPWSPEAKSGRPAAKSGSPAADPADQQSRRLDCRKISNQQTSGIFSLTRFDQENTSLNDQTNIKKFSAEEQPGSPSDESLAETAANAQNLLTETVKSLGQNLVGMENVIQQTLITLVAGGHALLEGVPGTAKTTLCRFLATVLGLDYKRIQFTPDLLPTDVTGTKIFDQSQGKFELQTGPVFCQFLLADELNRAPARTQSSLLEAMQERQVTIEGETLPLPSPFIVMATQNPVEQEGVYRLPEAQLDRFLFRIQVGYPDRNEEINLLEVHENPPVQLGEIWNTAKITKIQSAVNKVYCNKELKEYMIDLIRESRNHPDVLLGASPRAAIYLQKAARSRALLNGKTFFTHEDVQAMCHAVLEHRIIMRPEAELSGRNAQQVISELIQATPVRTA